ncbi:transcriptional regulator [Corynebacterium sp. LK14]|uniref:ArsR/SmtB family transcription factor n=1 Tax=Corynebacterium sp. LK14 TaxID=2022659 RepID=UPI0011C89DDE|nr:metalloregulator ArsR/SmtB family transcription factor [Corynebacterium sp. LK14]TXS64474.1 transcriptional regulator [Corynebacterium sp. LK14]
MPSPNQECCALGANPLTAEEAQKYAQLFKILGDPARLSLLSQLATEGCGPVSVNDLTKSSGLSQPTVSHHLKKLTEAGLLTKERAGRAVTHTVVAAAFAELRAVLDLG